MDKIEVELLKLDLSPEEVDNPELFVERIHNATTFEDWAEIRTMIHRFSSTEPPAT